MGTQAARSLLIVTAITVTRAFQSPAIGVRPTLLLRRPLFLSPAAFATASVPPLLFLHRGRNLEERRICSHSGPRNRFARPLAAMPPKALGSKSATAVKRKATDSPRTDAGTKRSKHSAAANQDIDEVDLVVIDGDEGAGAFSKAKSSGYSAATDPETSRLEVHYLLCGAASGMHARCSQEPCIQLTFIYFLLLLLSYICKKNLPGGRPRHTGVAGQGRIAAASRG